MPYRRWSIRQAASSSTTASKHPAKELDPVVWEMVEAGELEVTGPEHRRFECATGAVGAYPLDTSPDLDHPGGEPACHMKPVQDVGVICV